MKSFKDSFRLFFSNKKANQAINLALLLGAISFVAYFIFSDGGCVCSFFEEGFFLGIGKIILLIAIIASCFFIAIGALEFIVFIFSWFAIKSAITSNVFFQEDVLLPETQKKMLDYQITDAQEEIDSLEKSLKELEGAITLSKYEKIFLEQKRAERFGTFDL